MGEGGGVDGDFYGGGTGVYGEDCFGHGWFVSIMNWSGGIKLKVWRGRRSFLFRGLRYHPISYHEIQPCKKHGMTFIAPFLIDKHPTRPFMVILYGSPGRDRGTSFTILNVVFHQTTLKSAMRCE